MTETEFDEFVRVSKDFIDYYISAGRELQPMIIVLQGHIVNVIGGLGRKSHITDIIKQILGFMNADAYIYVDEAWCCSAAVMIKHSAKSPSGVPLDDRDDIVMVQGKIRGGDDYAEMSIIQRSVNGRRLKGWERMERFVSRMMVDSW